MLRHIRANLWLLVFTLVLCSVVYPLVLWAAGRAAFRNQAEGSLVDAAGKPVTDAARARGSLLIGQPFKGDEYFQPRPSNAGNGYDASQSGASNWGASNPLLRSRVSRQLGPIVKYAGDSPTKPGQPVGPDVEAWFQKQKPDFVARWAADHSGLAEQWVKDNPEVVAAWLKKSVEEVKGNAGDAAKDFFKTYAEKHPGTWPTVEETTIAGKAAKVLKPAREGADVQAYFFDLWLQDNRGAALEKVPADMVMSSGSGLDPHITLKSALYQLDRVADKWAGKPEMARVKGRVKSEIKDLLEEKASAPFGGLAGVKLVNVLEVNLVLADRMKRLADGGR
jgi:K+-transporting ATPase ATPase C chain